MTAGSGRNRSGRPASLSLHALALPPCCSGDEGRLYFFPHAAVERPDALRHRSQELGTSCPVEAGHCGTGDDLTRGENVAKATTSTSAERASLANSTCRSLHYRRACKLVVTFQDCSQLSRCQTGGSS